MSEDHSIPVEVVNERFDRIEKKIDKLSDAMIVLARTEEKIMAMEADKSNMIERLNRHSEKLDQLNDEVKENTRIAANITKITWLVVAAVIGVITKIIFLG
jgi:tetrahydromethanopterin S-methyltransferase subunit G